MKNALLELSGLLKSRAFLWNGEYAWNRADALRVLRWADENSFQLSGIEVWVASEDGPIITGYFWRPRAESDPHSSVTQAVDFVSNFSWRSQDSDLLQLVPQFYIGIVSSKQK